MTTPQFSILIPTRDRPSTFRHTLETVVPQKGNFEIVVADNCSSPGTRLIVEEYVSRYPNIKYTRSDSILPMADNWEKGLELCSGDYVTILGDDDALVPSTLEVANQLIDVTKSEIISWAMHTYWWPDTVAYWNANRLFVTFSNNQATWLDSNALLSAFYAGKAGFGDLPMIYNAFVHRNCIQRAIDTHGRYFSPPEMPPDVSSGILNLLNTERFVFSQRPLAVRGNSGKSNGTAHWARAFGAERRETYLREEGKTLEDLSHPELIPSENLHIVIANTKLKCKEIYFPNRKDLSIDPRQVLFELVDNLNFEPESYDANLADALLLAKKLNVDISQKIPPRKAISRCYFQGPFGGSNSISGVAVNCDQAGIFDIASAAKLADAMTQPITR
jgi:glycosyltransferase involved in cell wall biosynthesis